MSADFWRMNSRLEHITPPGTRFPEGFDVLELLRLKFPSGSVLDFGCGDGRMAPAFSAERYVGVDVNPHAIEACRRSFPGWRFEIAAEDLPAADAALAWTVLLHLDDEEVKRAADRLARAAPRIVVVEIPGRKWRGGRGQPACYNREVDDYERLFSVFGVWLRTLQMLPYGRYGGTEIAVMDFRLE